MALAALGEAEPVPVIVGYVSIAAPAGMASPELPGSAQQEVVAAITRTRETLGAELFDAGVERGTAMSFDEIVGYLLGELDALIAETPESVAGPPDGG